jgi:hypothetical protein
VGTVRLAKTTSLAGREAGLQLAIPLNRTNALKLDARWDRSESGSPGGEYEHRTDGSRFGLTWQRDTTDDPFTPRTGARTEAMLTYFESRFRSTTPWFDGVYTPSEPVTTRGEGDGFEGALLASRYWPLTAGYSIGIGAVVQGLRPTSRHLTRRGRRRPAPNFGSVGGR